MTTQQDRGGKAAPVVHVTTNTGRILRVNPADVDAASLPAATVSAVAGGASHADPARRTDVLFRKRRDEGHELSAWWMIGAFLVSSGLVIALLSGVPGIA
ncbi:hypothetical protein LTA6_000034 [Microbacterium sp. LTA6]|uniref:hypothetical protein n=1 Tax=unclassified Microbacterium TaxID=2609290 RepID=UPI003139E844